MLSYSASYRALDISDIQTDVSRLPKHFAARKPTVYYSMQSCRAKLKDFSDESGTTADFCHLVRTCAGVQRK